MSFRVSYELQSLVNGVEIALFNIQLLDCKAPLNEDWAEFGLLLSELLRYQCIPPR